MDGGSGNDTLSGCNGADTLIGGSGNDAVDGQQGVDTALLGSGNDTFQWDPGDGNDTVDGQGGADALTFNGSAIGELMHVSANGSRVNLTRNIANITTDLVGMERTLFVPRGGADVITVEDLTGTEMDVVEADFTADGAADSLISRGTEGPDAFKVGATGITGVGARTRVINGDTTGDFLTVAALGGDDTIDTGIVPLGPAWVSIDGGAGDDVTNYAGTAGDDLIAAVANGPVAHVSSPPATEIDVATERLNVLGGTGADQLSGTGNLAPLTALTMDGGTGDDRVLGGNGADTLLGGSGNDFVDGQQGNDVALLGSGNDTFQWDPGDGNDTVEGQGGSDSFAFNGSAIGEILDVSANGDARAVHAQHRQHRDRPRRRRADRAARARRQRRDHDRRHDRHRPVGRRRRPRRVHRRRRRRAGHGDRHRHRPARQREGQPRRGSGRDDRSADADADREQRTAQRHAARQHPRGGRPGHGRSERRAADHPGDRSRARTASRGPDDELGRQPRAADRLAAQPRQQRPGGGDSDLVLRDRDRGERRLHPVHERHVVVPGDRDVLGDSAGRPPPARRSSRARSCRCRRRSR